jgi:glutamine cyclotransferase
LCLNGRRAVVLQVEQVARAIPSMVLIVAAAAAASLLDVVSLGAQRAATVRQWGYKVVKAYPHDPTAYTQGLIFRDGFLYESTGLNGRSTLRKVRLETGEVLQQRVLDAKHFGEGLTEFQGQLVQLTWQSNLAFVYDLRTLSPTRTFSFRGEGWGLTHGPEGFFLSDGTAQLRVLDAASFAERRRVTVMDRKTPVDQLNELEFVKGEVWANVWHTDRVARIEPRTGRVAGWIDLSGLMGMYRLDAEAVLNGIAYDAASGRIFVTGKLWPRLFEIQIVPKTASPAPGQRSK